MKLLYLVRHAKAISQKLGVNDFKRSLSKQGVEDAKAMGKRLKKKGLSLDLLLSSPADRALETAHIFARELEYPVQRILLRDEFYDEDKDIILEILKSMPDTHERLMLFGHDPALSQMAALFLQDTEIELRTSGVIGIALEIERWQELTEAAGTLIFFDFPVRATPKVYKKARKAIAAEITASMENILEDIDSGSSKQLEKILDKTSKKLAKQLTRVLHASKVEDIAEVKRVKQRIDAREDFEQSLRGESVPKEDQQLAGGPKKQDLGTREEPEEIPRDALKQKPQEGSSVSETPPKRRSPGRKTSKSQTAGLDESAGNQ